MVGHGVLDIDLGKELKVDSVLPVLVLAGEAKLGGGELELEGIGGDVGGRDGEVDDVLLGFGGGRALSPEDFTGWG